MNPVKNRFNDLNNIITNQNQSTMSSLENEFFVALSLNEADRKKYQLVYCSSLYDTFFCVYAKFKFEKSEGEDHDAEFSKAKFKIFNFKGPVNIGLKEVIYDAEKQEFLLLVQGLCDAPEDFKEEATFWGGSGFSFDKPLKFERKLLPLNDGDSDENPMPYKHGFFDSEFYKRDGTSHIRRPMDEEAFDDLSEASTLYNGLPENGFAPGNLRCIRSTSYIRF
ncbi:MAG: hypothetical protein CL868_10455 [Cytophagaceae bacterium]|nr:hypothetical protein [Cytophagaceae bacterium]